MRISTAATEHPVSVWDKCWGGRDLTYFEELELKTQRIRKSENGKDGRGAGRDGGVLGERLRHTSCIPG